MKAPTLRRWAPLSILIGMLLVGIAFRLGDVLPGWGTLLIISGAIGGAVVAYGILLGKHERPMLLDRRREEWF